MEETSKKNKRAAGNRANGNVKGDIETKPGNTTKKPEVIQVEDNVPEEATNNQENLCASNNDSVEPLETQEEEKSSASTEGDSGFDLSKPSKSTESNHNGRKKSPERKSATTGQSVSPSKSPSSASKYLRSDDGDSAKSSKPRVVNSYEAFQSGLSSSVQTVIGSAGVSRVADSKVITALKTIYREKLHPIEKKYMFQKFNQPAILDSELSAKPMVLLVGQYSTGKTSFIRHLIGMDYPEMHIGPEPTTDKFVAIVHGDQKKTIMGNTTTGIDDLPFSGLSAFGSNFLSKFCAAVVPSPVLKSFNIIDTPGVLSGEKQRISRGYDFGQVSRWFAHRSDMIFLMFDCSKLDISDEFKAIIEQLQPYEEKVHCVLNKADQLDTESLIRVYGALLWSMGRIFKGAEVTRVYVGTFRTNDLESLQLEPEQLSLFQRDRNTLMNSFLQLPSASSLRKINEIVKRIRLLIVHICVSGYLRSKVPMFWGRQAAQQKIVQSIPEIFAEVQKMYQLAEGDFPPVVEFQQCLSKMDLSSLQSLDYKTLSLLQDLLTMEIPKITKLVSGVGEDLSTLADGDENDNSRQPSLFTLAEDALLDNSNKKGEVGLAGIVTIVAAIVAVIAGFIFASHLEGHQTVKLLAAYISKA